ncbi:acyltransferase family protein [Butyrivibrio sp. AC2005]|uniref:acyltransferase family protein n=1 Tax=Butyrivibrio sp. AC2005 TaxID=1280672 RepID=UPI001A97D785|nr:acyltransferase family protein [Butyrivibrio sp. AC2005]
MHYDSIIYFMYRLKKQKIHFMVQRIINSAFWKKQKKISGLDMGKKNYYAIDLFKFIFAFCVVAIHTGPLDGCMLSVVSTFYDIFVAIAVPFFFISSGFFLAQKMQYPFQIEANEIILKKYIKKNVKLYLIWSVIYFPLALVHFASRKIQPLRAVMLYVRRLIFIG